MGRSTRYYSVAEALAMRLFGDKRMLVSSNVQRSAALTL